MFSSSNIPSSSYNTIIIPFDREENKFSRTVYSTSMTGGRASCDEVNQVLTLLEIAASNIFTSFQAFKYILIRLLIPSFVIWILAGTWRCFKLDPFFFIWCYYIFRSFFYVLIKKSGETEEVKKQVHKIIQRFQPLFKERGLRWNIPRVFPLYVELCRDYREQFFETQIPYNPQANIQLSTISLNQEYQPLKDTTETSEN